MCCCDYSKQFGTPGLYSWYIERGVTRTDYSITGWYGLFCVMREYERLRLGTRQYTTST